MKIFQTKGRSISWMRVLLITIVFVLFCSSISQLSVGQIAYAASENESLSTSVESFVTLQLNDKSYDVGYLQLRLIELGYLTEKADGKFGKKTQEAVIAYQRAAGYSNLDGIATPELQAEIYSEYAIGIDGQYHTYIKPTVPPKSSTSNKSSDKKSGSGNYIANKKTGKFHKAGCSAVKKMNDSSKKYYSSREDCIKKGYVPCKKCNP